MLRAKLERFVATDHLLNNFSLEYNKQLAEEKTNVAFCVCFLSPLAWQLELDEYLLLKPFHLLEEILGNI